jgi:hypothetical protein
MEMIVKRHDPIGARQCQAGILWNLRHFRESLFYDAITGRSHSELVAKDAVFRLRRRAAIQDSNVAFAPCQKRAMHFLISPWARARMRLRRG